MLIGSFVSQISCLPVVLLTLHIIFSMPSNSISGIPKSTGPLPSTTKNLYLATLSLCLNLTEQTLHCSMFELLYVFNTTVMFLWHTKLLLLT